MFIDIYPHRCTIKHTGIHTYKYNETQTHTYNHISTTTLNLAQEKEYSNIIVYLYKEQKMYKNKP